MCNWTFAIPWIRSIWNKDTTTRSIILACHIKTRVMRALISKITVVTDTFLDKGAVCELTNSTFTVATAFRCIIAQWTVLTVSPIITWFANTLSLRGPNVICQRIDRTSTTITWTSSISCIIYSTCGWNVDVSIKLFALNETSIHRRV